MKESQLRKIKLSVAEERILRLLEEAGTEDLGCVFNSLLLFEESSLDSVQRIETAIEHLLRLRLITLYKDYQEPRRVYVELSEKQIAEALPLSQLFRWNENKRCWVRQEEATEEQPTGLMLTEKGREMLVR